MSAQPHSLQSSANRLFKEHHNIMARSARITVKQHNQAYFEALQTQIDCDNATETLNYLLTNLKARGFSLLDNPSPIYQQAQQIQSIAHTVPAKPNLTVVGAVTPPVRHFEEISQPLGDDPILDHLIAAGLESF